MREIPWRAGSVLGDVVSTLNHTYQAPNSAPSVFYFEKSGSEANSQTELHEPRWKNVSFSVSFMTALQAAHF
ncbi:PREDICTED: protein SPHAR [Galeopterus variegatus]|uniref:Protein SPHAR n=1 Tax=Galeopterus variegatus TaxID=482537 RepID=A0ABM0RS21_GALVR|nr:PREDICTED: protein SPHAR [Galeopterus variegatus]